MKTLAVTKIPIHVFAWLAFISYEVLSVLPFYNWQFGNFWDYTVHYVINISLFYFNAHVILSRVITQSKKSYVIYFLLLIVQLLIYMLLKYVILYAFDFFHVPLAPAFYNNTDYIIGGIVRALYFISFSTAYWFALTSLQNRKRIAELESTHLKDQIARRKLEVAIISTENAYLKSQINPHFLFNTLNFLYNSVSKFSAKIADSFMSLSDIMHYALSEVEADGKVSLESEIDNIKNFIKLNQDRFGQKLKLIFAVTGYMGDQRIIPLALMTLVENMFKYGDLFNTEMPAKINLTVYNGRITFTTENKKKRASHAESHGIGIRNLENRLTAYHNYKLDLENGDEVYKSVLQVWA